MAQDLGIPVREDIFSRDELYLADEAFLTGTAAEVTPIREVDARIIGAGKPGPITQKLQAAFFDVVKGKDPALPAVADLYLKTVFGFWFSGEKLKKGLEEIIPQALFYRILITENRKPYFRDRRRSP